MKVTLHDVARLAGVSIKTVSRVVNHQGEISLATRQRVQTAIDQLGYRPNILARSLVSRRSYILGVVAWGIEYYAPSRIISGIEHQASQFGYSLFLSLVAHPTEERVPQILDTLIAHQVDGIIWAVPEVGDNHAWLQTAQAGELPPVMFASMSAQPGWPSVAVDNRLGGYLATQHLLQRNRKRIGLLAGPGGWWEAAERTAGWRDALNQAGLPPVASQIVEADWSTDSGAFAMQLLLEQQPELDAVFASSDQIALGALNTLINSSRKVPEDIALVGFDNIPESAYFQPPLTTIHQPLFDIGCLAVEKLHAMIEAQHRGLQIELPTAMQQSPTLIVRAST